MLTLPPLTPGHASVVVLSRSFPRGIEANLRGSNLRRMVAVVVEWTTNRSDNFSFKITTPLTFSTIRSTISSTVQGFEHLVLLRHVTYFRRFSAA